MKHSKYHYIKMLHVGYAWCGFWAGLHHFVKKTAAGYLEMKCRESDIDDSSLMFMCEKESTR